MTLPHFFEYHQRVVLPRYKQEDTHYDEVQKRGSWGTPLHQLPYGYQKDPDNKKRWIVDEEAAEVVKRIFALCLEGYGPSQIARILKTDKVITPTIHFQRTGRATRNTPPDNPYHWTGDTVADILERPKYQGHTVNFKTYKQSYKSKNTCYNPKEKQLVRIPMKQS